jgi:hypothetical protein
MHRVHIHDVVAKLAQRFGGPPVTSSSFSISAYLSLPAPRNRNGKRHMV